MKRTLSVSCIALLFSLSSPPFAGAVRIGDVDGATVSAQEIEVELHVNIGHPAASDGNSGESPDLPLASLRGALEVASDHLDAGRATRIRFAPGIYRDEEAVFYRADSANAMETRLIIEGEERGSVILSGARLYTEADFNDEGGGLFSLDWPHTFPVDDAQSFDSAVDDQYLLAMNYIVTVNGQLLRQVVLEPYLWSSNEWAYVEVLKRGPEAIRAPGAFGVSERISQKLYFRLPEGVEPADARLEVSFQHDDRQLTIRRKSNLEVRNLVFSHGGGVRIWGGADARSENILIENCEFVLSKAGPSLSLADGLTFRDSIIAFNAINGITGSTIQDYLFERLHIHDNLYKGWQGAPNKWSRGGAKLLNLHYGNFRDIYVYDNGTHGWWFDSGVDEVRVTNLVAVGNQLNGFYNENNGIAWMIVEDSVAAFNGEYGINHAETRATTYRDNIVFGNGSVEFNFRDRPPLRSFEDRFGIYGGTVTTGTFHITLENNRIMATRDDRLGRRVINNLNLDLATFSERNLSTLTAAGNTYYSLAGEDVFGLSAVDAVNLADWKGLLRPGQEDGSIFSDPGFVDRGGKVIASYYFDLGPEIDLAALQDLVANGEEAQSTRVFPAVELPANFRNDYGVVVRGEFIPDRSGRYTFHIASGGESALYIDDGSGTLVPVHRVEAPVGRRDWAAASPGVLADAELTGGVPLYFELWYRAGGHDTPDHLAMGWERADTGIELARAPFIGRDTYPEPVLRLSRPAALTSEGIWIDVPEPDGQPLFRTTDGSEPDRASPPYTGPEFIDADATFRVRAVAPPGAYEGSSNSTAHTVQRLHVANAFPFAHGVEAIAFEAEAFHNKRDFFSSTWSLAAVAGASGGIFNNVMRSGPTAGTVFTGENFANAGRLDYNVRFMEAGVYYLWVRGVGNGSGADAVFVGIDGITLPNDSRYLLENFGDSGLSWRGTTTDGERVRLDIPEPGHYLIHVWVGINGVQVDKLHITRDPSDIPAERGIAVVPPIPHHKRLFAAAAPSLGTGRTALPIWGEALTAYDPWFHTQDDGWFFSWGSRADADGAWVYFPGSGWRYTAAGWFPWVWHPDDGWMQAR